MAVNQRASALGRLAVVNFPSPVLPYRSVGSLGRLVQAWLINAVS
jgi:hypothetical protein